MPAPELELTNESHALAKAWVSRNWNRSAKPMRYAAPEARPARLGLGAKFVPHKPEADRVHSKGGQIEAKLRRDLGLSTADATSDSPRCAEDGRVHRAQPGWAKGVDKVQDGNASNSGDSDSGGDDETDSRTALLGVARGKLPEGGSVHTKRQREPQEAPNIPARRKSQKRGPVVQAASALPGDIADGASLTPQQRKKQRRRQRKAAAAAAAAASATAEPDAGFSEVSQRNSARSESKEND